MYIQSYWFSKRLVFNWNNTIERVQVTSGKSTLIYFYHLFAKHSWRIPSPTASIFTELTHLDLRVKLSRNMEQILQSLPACACYSITWHAIDCLRNSVGTGGQIESLWWDNYLGKWKKIISALNFIMWLHFFCVVQGELSRKYKK